MIAFSFSFFKKRKREQKEVTLNILSLINAVCVFFRDVGNAVFASGFYVTIVFLKNHLVSDLRAKADIYE